MCIQTSKYRKHKSDSTSHFSILSGRDNHSRMWWLWDCYLTLCFWPVEKIFPLISLSQEFLVTKSETGNCTQDKTLLCPLVSYYRRPHVSHVTYHTGHTVTLSDPQKLEDWRVSAEDSAVLSWIYQFRRV